MAGQAGAELPLKAYFLAMPGRPLPNKTQEEFRWQQD